VVIFPLVHRTSVATTAVHEYQIFTIIFPIFLLQATLVALFYVFQYFAVIYLILKNSPLTQNLTSITDNINTLLRLQTQLIGKQFFLTLYALLLAFLFLPAGLMGGQAVTTLEVNLCN